jgi:hypothetical protein
MTKSWLTVSALLCAFVLLAPSVRGDEKAQENAQARLEAARKVYNGMLERQKVDPGFQTSFETLNLWSRRWLEAQRELSDKKEDRITAAADHLERMKKLQDLVTRMIKTGVVNRYEAAAGDFYRLEAEHWLAEARGK